jgi:hypothetical protein
LSDLTSSGKVGNRTSRKAGDRVFGGCARDKTALPLWPRDRRRAHVSGEARRRVLEASLAGGEAEDASSSKDPAGHAGARPLARIRNFMNDQGVAHEVVVVAVSYGFIYAGAWNDSILGFQPTIWSRSAEFAMAAILAFEIAFRIAWTRIRDWKFWAVMGLDFASLLTVFPLFSWIAFARLLRLFYASQRLAVLLDKVSHQKKNAAYLIGVFPLIVPMMAAAVYVLERDVTGSPIQNYAQALGVCFAFSLSLGNVRPTSAWSMAICGTLFLMGVVCVGILTNTISARYQQKE